MTDRRLKVAVVLHGYEIFGIREFLLNQLAHASEYGIDCEYVCLGPGDFYEYLYRAGVPVTVVGVSMPFDRVNRGNPFIWLLRNGRFKTAYRGILRYLKSRRPDIVYSHHDYMHVLCGTAARRAGCCAIGQLHRIVNRTPFWGLQRVLVSIAYAWALDGILAISEVSRDSMWGAARRKASVIYNGVDVEAIRRSVEGVKRQPGRLVLVGRITGGKKQELAIRAVKLLASEHIECVLELVGGPAHESNSYYRRLRDLVRELGVEDKVVFSGVLSPPYERVASSEVFINCSTYEGFGLVIVEAMACGTPVVVANGGGPAELVADGRTGVYFDAGCPESLAAALKCLLSDSGLRSRLAEAAYQEAKWKFDIGAHMRGFRAQLLKYSSMARH